MSPVKPSTSCVAWTSVLHSPCIVPFATAGQPTFRIQKLPLRATWASGS